MTRIGVRWLACVFTAGLGIGLLCAPSMKTVWAQVQIIPGVNFIRLANGTAALPSLGYIQDPTTGRYWVGSGNVGEATAGVLRFDWNATRFLSTIPFQATTYAAGTTKTIFASTTDGLAQLKNNAQTFGIELNAGTAAPTLGACGTGPTLTAGSRNTAGEVTLGTVTTTCVVNFGAPAFTNTPFCVIDDETTVGGRISALSTTSFTVAALTASDKFIWICLGRV